MLGADSKTPFDTSEEERPVSMTIGLITPWRLSSRMTSVPLMSGSTQSTRTRSGWPPVPSSIASAPLAASRTSCP